jgi:putative PIN family toxin of toxin-antitoxin system
VRVVLDTSVIISAFLFPESIPGQVLLAVARRHRLLVSPAIAAEYAETLCRSKFDRMGTRKDRLRAVQDLVSRRACVSVVPRVRVRLIAADVDDNRFLEVAAAGRAALLVSGDGHLLRLRSWLPQTATSPIPILNPAAALACLQGSTGGAALGGM